VDLLRAAWRKSSFSQLSSCVEVAFIDGRVAVRDSKDRNGPVLVFDHSEWRAFLSGVHDGQFELSGQD
jgi:hypothetical protein